MQTEPIVIGHATLFHGDCLDYLKLLPENSVDSVCTDPPAGINFMNRPFDSDRGGRDSWIDWLASIFKEVYRVMKPGAHGLVWALPRTSHWTAMGLELAGFNIRDRIAYSFDASELERAFFGSLNKAQLELWERFAESQDPVRMQHYFGVGFPKAVDVSKQIDVLLCEKRKVIGIDRRPIGGNSYNGGNGQWKGGGNITTPATSEAVQWDGWKSSLKPAVEDYWLIRKPLDGTIAQNILKHGVGGISINSSRIRERTIDKQIERVRMFSFYGDHKADSNISCIIQKNDEAFLFDTTSKLLSDAETWLLSVLREGLNGRSYQEPPSFLANCPIYFHFCDVLVRSVRVDDQVSVLQQGYAHKHILVSKTSDDHAYEQVDNLLHECISLLSNFHYQAQLSNQDDLLFLNEQVRPAFLRYSKSLIDCIQTLLKEELSYRLVDNAVQRAILALQSIISGTDKKDEDSLANILCVVFAIPYLITNTMRCQLNFLEKIGRYPAHLILDGSPAVCERFPNANGSGDKKLAITTAHEGYCRPGRSMFTHDLGSVGYHDQGSASRFFKSCPIDPFVYHSKASSADRNSGCEELEARFSPTMNNGIGGKEHDPETATPKRNIHPTCKSQELFKYFCTLLTPPAGLVLDPFIGSGTTGIAAVKLGYRFIGCEMEAEYFEIAKARIAAAQRQTGLF